jgi:hypothetical protein
VDGSPFSEVVLRSAKRELAVQAERSGFLLQPTPTGIKVIPTLGNGPLTGEDIAESGNTPQLRDQLMVSARQLTTVSPYLMGVRYTRAIEKERWRRQ